MASLFQEELSENYGICDQRSLSTKDREDNSEDAYYHCLEHGRENEDIVCVRIT